MTDESDDTKPDWADEKAEAAMRGHLGDIGFMTDAVAQALRDEREACARVAEKRGYRGVAWEIRAPTDQEKA